MNTWSSILRAVNGFVGCEVLLVGCVLTVTLFVSGWASRERDRLVPLASWIRVLALWYRRVDPDDEPAVPGPLRRRRGSCCLASL